MATCPGQHIAGHRHLAKDRLPRAVELHVGHLELELRGARGEQPWDDALRHGRVQPLGAARVDGTHATNEALLDHRCGQFALVQQHDAPPHRDARGEAGRDDEAPNLHAHNRLHQAELFRDGPAEAAESIHRLQLGQGDVPLAALCDDQQQDVVGHLAQGCHRVGEGLALCRSQVDAKRRRLRGAGKDEA